MYSQNVGHIIGRAETDFSTAGATKRNDLDKDSFLRLLVAQLEHQDPLDPKSDTEFIAQLAQFSSLEQLTNINSSIVSMEKAMGRQDLLGAVSFIGKEVTATGYSLAKEGSKVSSLHFKLPEGSMHTFANIFDGQGNVVRTVNFGPKQAGIYEYTWDGKDYAGNTLKDGVYFVGMAAEGGNGQPVLIDMSVSGVVAGISNQNGQTVLRLKDGREIMLADVREIISPGSGSESNQEG
jgi:flagellar basal-body rod modification protein FlgD